MGTKNVIIYNHGKNELSIKNTPGYIQYADALKKSPLHKFVQDFIGNPPYHFRKKVPRI